VPSLGCFAGALICVLSGFLFKGYLCCFLQVRVTAIPGKLIDIVRNPHTAKVKRIKAMGDALG